MAWFHSNGATRPLQTQFGRKFLEKITAALNGSKKKTQQQTGNEWCGSLPFPLNWGKGRRDVLTRLENQTQTAVLLLFAFSFISSDFKINNRSNHDLGLSVFSLRLKASNKPSPVHAGTESSFSVALNRTTRTWAFGLQRTKHAEVRAFCLVQFFSSVWLVLKEELDWDIKGGKKGLECADECGWWRSRGLE